MTAVGRPRAGYLVLDAVRRLWHPIAPTLVAVLIAFAATVALFATTWQALASQQRTLERINSPAGRLIEITDPQGEAGLSARSVAAVERMSGVEWVFGIGPAVDVRSVGIDGGATAPARPAYGSFPMPIDADDAGSLMPGQALAGPGLIDRLGLGDGVGAVTSRTLNAVIVDGFVAASPIESLNASVLVSTDAEVDGARLLTLWVSVADVSQLPDMTTALTGTVVASDVGALRVTTSDELALLSADISAELARSAQVTIAGLVVAVAVLIGAVQFGRVASMSRDIGRRRALGANRTAIMLTVLLTAALSMAVGALLGTAAGLVVTAAIAGALPPLGFTVSVGLLILLASILGAVPPAIRASRLDPVAILRVP